MDRKANPQGARGAKGGEARPVAYWMQAALRIKDNPALNLALRESAASAKPPAVFFALDTSYPLANRRSWNFLVESLRDVAASLKASGIPFRVFRGTGDALLAASPEFYSLVVTDGGAMPIQREWKNRAALLLKDRFREISTETVLPLGLTGEKAEWSAATLRRKLVPLLPFHGNPEPWPGVLSWSGNGDNFYPAEWETLDPGLSPDDLIPGLPAFPEPVPGMRGGESQAWAQLEHFTREKLSGYSTGRNNPVLEYQSGLSPYLHFGNISPRSIRSRVLEEPPSENTEDFLEELLVRRDLSFNYARFNPKAGTYGGLPDWARKTLEAHAGDPRDYLYTLEDWEAARTHDRAWNAAQNQLVHSGRMAGYMRMYWGKKILEWSASPGEAFQTALFLNDKYALDGRDPNSLAGVAWCFGLHDRPWTERKVFGMVRYMNENGLRRKFDLEAYIRRWSLRVAPGESSGV